MKNHITCPIQQAVADVNCAFDWTGIREGGFQFGAKEVRACGWDGDSYRWYTASAETPSKAYDALRKEIPTGQQRIEKLRADAAKLIAEAEAIQPAAPTIDFP
jgi:arginase family enzyme